MPLVDVPGLQILMQSGCRCRRREPIDQDKKSSRLGCDAVRPSGDAETAQRVVSVADRPSRVEE